MLIIFIKLLYYFIMMIFSMGFFLFLERKILGLLNFRLGPNKVSFNGLLQFIFDSFKLIFKDLGLFSYYGLLNLLVFFIFLIMNLFMWLVIDLNFYLTVLDLVFLIFFLILMFKLLVLIVFVYYSDSVYVYLSLVRCLVQLISYDLIIILVFVVFIYVFDTLNFSLIFLNQMYMYMFFFDFFVFFVWFLSLLMELFRVPFDFLEGESELVSGFNMEFGSFFFMLIFMVEYLDLIFMFYLSSLMFFFGVFNVFYMFFYLYLVVLIRGYLIRLRYDLFLILSWFVFFPFLFLLFFFSLIFF